MQIIFTFYAGDAGAAALCSRYQKALEKRFSEAYLAPVGILPKGAQIMAEKAVFEAFGASYRMCGAGGVLRTLFEMARDHETGLEVDEDAVLIRQETVEICEFFDLNPYAILSDGCAVAFSEDGAKLLEALRDAGVPAAIIGRTVPGKKKILYRRGEAQCLNRPKPDGALAIF